MISLKEIESRNHILIKRPKLRKVEVVLDLVVPIQMLEELGHTRGEGAPKIRRGPFSTSKFFCHLAQLRALKTERLVNVQPGGGQVAEIFMLLPASLWVGFAQVSNRTWQSSTGVQ